MKNRTIIRTGTAPTAERRRLNAGCRNVLCSMSGSRGSTRNARNVWRRYEVGKNGYLERRKVRDEVMQDAALCSEAWDEEPEGTAAVLA